jgi:hypothetical protein
MKSKTDAKKKPFSQIYNNPKQAINMYNYYIVLRDELTSGYIKLVTSAC